MTRAERFHRARRDPELAVLEGFHAIKHALRFDARVEEIVVLREGPALALSEQLAPELTARLTAADAVTTAEFDTLAPLPHPTGAIAIARRSGGSATEVLLAPGPAPLVLLETPVHLGNLGAAVRVSAAAGAAGLLATGRLDPWQPEAVRAAAGLQYALPVARIDALSPSTRTLVAIDVDGAPIDREAVPDDAILAFGTERSGLSSALRASADRAISIPMSSGVSSLNLATAVAVVLYAWRLGRGTTPAHQDRRDQTTP